MNCIYQNLSHPTASPEFRGRPAWFVQLWWIIQALFFHTSPQVMYGWRRCLLRVFGAKIGEGVLIRPSVSVTYPWKLAIGDWSWIGDDVTLYSLGEISIGDHTVISQQSYLCTGSHDYKSPSFDLFAVPIHVESEVWIASRVFIGPGVTIGHGAMVGAASVVLNDLPSKMICAGHPVKIIRARPVPTSPVG